MNRRPQMAGELFVEQGSSLDTFRLNTFSPYIRQAESSWRSKWYLAPRKLLDYLAVFIVEGEGIFRVGDDEFRVEVNDLIWIPPDTEHEMRGTSAQMHCSYIHFDLIYDPLRSHWNAYFPGNTIDLSDFSVLQHPPLNDLEIDQWCGKLTIKTPRDIRELFERICLEYRRCGSGANLLLSGLMLQLLSKLLEVPENISSNSYYSEKMQLAAEWITENYQEKLDIGKLAKQAGLSKSHFRKLFRETHNTSPRRLYQQTRMRRACEMLAYTSMNISEIAEELGFSNINNFSRAFRNATSMSPSQYQQRRALR
jgi:AraC-like DNA-binding protein